MTHTQTGRSAVTREGGEMTKEKATIAMVLSEDNQSFGYGERYHHTTVRFATIGPVPGPYSRSDVPEDKIELASSYTEPNGCWLAHLSITDQSASDKPATSYAWKLQFKGVDVTVETAPKMASTLTKIENRVRKITNDEGSPADFAAYVMVVARAMGVTVFLTVNTPQSREMTGEDFRRMNGNDAVYRLRAYQADFATSCQPKAEAA